MVQAEWPGRAAAERLRQWSTLSGIADAVRAASQFSGLILVGSLAGGKADPLSDIDLIAVAEDGRFNAAWERREVLHVTGQLASWDWYGRESRWAIGPVEGTEVALHTWLTSDLVMVEALIATPRSGARIAEPAVVLVGPGDLLKPFARRSPISRSEMEAGGHPVELAYDALKQAVRSAQQSEPLA